MIELIGKKLIRSREQLRLRAKFNGLTTCLIRDAGRTRIDSGRRTVLGIGPGTR